MAQANSDVTEMAARAESWNMHLLGHSDLAGHGDGSRLDKQGDFLFVAHRIAKAPGVHSHKLQIVGDLLLTNHERGPRETGPDQPGRELYDVSRADSPKRISFFPTHDRGVHRFWFSDGQYAHVPTSADGYSNRIYRIVDVKKPTCVEEVGRWWLPELLDGQGEGKGGAFPHLALHPDPSAMQLNELLGQR